MQYGLPKDEKIAAIPSQAGYTYDFAGTVHCHDSRTYRGLHARRVSLCPRNAACSTHTHTCTHTQTHDPNSEKPAKKIPVTHTRTPTPARKKTWECSTMYTRRWARSCAKIAENLVVNHLTAPAENHIRGNAYSLTCNKNMCCVDTKANRSLAVQNWNSKNVSRKRKRD
jgi:hypothetical protein